VGPQQGLPAVPGNGLFYGETKLFMVQLLAMIGVSLFAFLGTFVLLKITDLIMPLRVSEIEEQEGLDWSQHEERL
jgi:Amt family ammonium transporter